MERIAQDINRNESENHAAPNPFDVMTGRAKIALKRQSYAMKEYPKIKVVQTTKCSVLNCCHISKSTCLFKLPSDPALRQKWISAAGGLTMLDNRDTSSVNFCADHFESCMFKDGSMDSLISYAVPTVFDWNLSKDRVSSNKTTCEQPERVKGDTFVGSNQEFLDNNRVYECEISSSASFSTVIEVKNDPIFSNADSEIEETYSVDEDELLDPLNIKETSQSLQADPLEFQSCSTVNPLTNEQEKARYCAAFYCKNNIEMDCMMLFSFPEDLELRMKWIEACKRFDIQDKNYKSMALCQNHFDKKSFTVTDKVVLNKDAVPCIFNLPKLPADPEQAKQYHPPQYVIKQRLAVEPDLPRTKQNKRKTVERRNKTIKYCAAFNCDNNRLMEGVSLFTFPADPERREKWIEASRRYDIRHKNYHSMVLCRDHFEDKFLFEGRTMVTRNAIPSIFNFDQPLNKRIGPTNYEKTTNVQNKKAEPIPTSKVVKVSKDDTFVMNQIPTFVKQVQSSIVPEVQNVLNKGMCAKNKELDQARYAESGSKVRAEDQDLTKIKLIPTKTASSNSKLLPPKSVSSNCNSLTSNAVSANSESLTPKTVPDNLKPVKVALCSVPIAKFKAIPKHNIVKVTKEDIFGKLRNARIAKEAKKGTSKILANNDGKEQHCLGNDNMSEVTDDQPMESDFLDQSEERDTPSETDNWHEVIDISEDDNDESADGKELDKERNAKSGSKVSAKDQDLINIKSITTKTASSNSNSITPKTVSSNCNPITSNTVSTNSDSIMPKAVHDNLKPVKVVLCSVPIKKFKAIPKGNLVKVTKEDLFDKLHNARIAKEAKKATSIKSKNLANTDGNEEHCRDNDNMTEETDGTPMESDFLDPSEDRDAPSETDDLHEVVDISEDDNDESADDILDKLRAKLKAEKEEVKRLKRNLKRRKGLRLNKSKT